MSVLIPKLLDAPDEQTVITYSPSSGLLQSVDTVFKPVATELPATQILVTY